MKKFLLNLLPAALICFLWVEVSAQNAKFEIYIQSTGVVSIEDEDDEGNPITLTFDASTDDAEQENDEVDTAFDDDLDAGWEGAPEDQNILTMGLRFRDIFIPQGATIDSAFIVLNAHEGKDAEDVARLTISAEAADSASTFDEENFNNEYLLTDRPTTNASVLWEVAEEWGIWEFYSTPDLKDIVQEIVDRDGWKMGNPIAFIIGGENQGPSDVDNAREFCSYENIADPEDGGDGQNHPERRPKFVVYYTAPSYTYSSYIKSTGFVTIEDEDDNGNPITLTFDASTDDAEQENDEVDTAFDDDLDAGWEGAPEDQNILTTGLRFTNISIPQGATIESAYLVMNAHEGKDAEDVARMTIQAEAADSAFTFDEENFNNDYLLTDRPKTNASVMWEVDEAWDIWGFYESVDFSEVIQEVVDREGWKQGNAIALFLQGENQGPSDVDNAREFCSYENIADPEDGGDGQNHPERRPRLVINFSLPTVGGTQTVTLSDSDITVFPNPSNEIINVEIKNQKEAQIFIYDLTGKVVASDFAGSTLNQINVSNLNKGIYVLKAIQGENAYVQKIVVE